jgi:hypothetical protein
MLDLAIPTDSPLFRAHLYTLSHTTSLLARTCKSALISAGEVRDCLEALRKAEQRFMGDLEKLDKVLSTGETQQEVGEVGPVVVTSPGDNDDDPSSSTSPSTITPRMAGFQSPIRILATQLETQRTLEMERMDQMVLSRLRGTRDGLKVRGVVGGSGATGTGEAVALVSFEVSFLGVDGRWYSKGSSFLLLPFCDPAVVMRCYTHCV